MDHAIQKMVVEMQIRGLAESSQKKYVQYVKKLQKFCGKPVTEVTENEIKVFLYHLAATKKLSASTVNAHNAALKFLYEKH
ncbi:site-specific integrase [Clostridium sp. Marseille-P2415]|uniref:site-specific integrase n=1 Tax=Clostridium sp. Marseille-P2415 TaxID=1805471 RepID=UPI00098856CB|nr:site-specific integrase [Clostridium sp. Marseille-P2415]